MTAIAGRLADDPAVITELDVEDAIRGAVDSTGEVDEDWRYFDEVRSCCGGRDQGCGHYGTEAS
jgi:hypothetical protein